MTDSPDRAGMSAFLSLQRLLPRHALSRLFGRLAASEHALLSRTLIDLFSRTYRVSLDETVRRNPRDYTSFNDFFSRELAPGARPMPSSELELVSPADGVMSQFGAIERGQLIQAKGKPYSCAELLADDGLAAMLDGGWFSTVYLAPADYHRVHLPYAGQLRRTNEIPGELFSVNATTEQGIADLFCRNERLVCEFDTDVGPMALVLVGALIVASIVTVWEGSSSPYLQRRERRYDQAFERGDEIGHFQLGSTVIVMMPPGSVTPNPELRQGQTLRVGQSLGSVRHPEH